MITDFIFIAVAIVGAFAGTITDLKGRWVPDWISYFMIIFGITGHIVVSIMQWNILPAVYSAAAAAIFYGIANLLFYSGVWGGGDAKLFVGFGALLPFYTPGMAAPWPWLLTLWLNTLIFGSIFGVSGSIFLAFKHKNKFMSELKTLIQKNKVILCATPIFFAVACVIYLLNLSTTIYIPLLAILLLLTAFPILYVILKSVEYACMFKHIAPHKLVEGDWIAEEVSVENYNYKPAKTGIEKKDIVKLIELEKSGKLKQIKIKEGLPYVPAMFAGLLASIFYGDLMFAAIMGFLV